jgi:hypothetical protein
MVCADVLARQGVPVCLRVGAHPSSVLGRSFRYVRLDGMQVEAGARLLELDYGDDIRDPNPRGYVFGHHRSMIGLIREYVSTLTVPRRADLWQERGHQMRADFMLSSNLHSLPSFLSQWEREAIEREARLAVDVVGLHGLSRAALLTKSYRGASRLLHGWTFHRIFVDPLVDAILGESAADLPALDHRRIWLPLFTPGEVLDAVRGESERPVREMYFGMGAAVEQLVRRVEPLVGASLPRGPISVVTDIERAPAKKFGVRLIWSWDPDSGTAPSTQWIQGRPIYRQTHLDGVRCWEMNADATKEGMWSDALGEAVVRLPMSEAADIDTHSGRVGVGSFNEQVAQGISAAAWRMG